MLQFGLFQWMIVSLCALMIGFSKAGIMGAAAPVVPLLAAVMPARQSIGFLLPMLIIGDITATLFWWRFADWKELFRIFPWMLVGVFTGYQLLGYMTDRTLMAVIGMIVLFLVMLHLWQQRRPDPSVLLSRNSWFTRITGFMAGTTSMLANSAGPIMVLYLLVMGLDKRRFIGTAALFFLVMNCVKLPFSVGLSLVTPQSLITNLALAPLIVLGGFIGAVLVRHIPQRSFDLVMQVMTALMGCWLCANALAV